MFISALMRRSKQPWHAVAAVGALAAIVALAGAPGYVSRDGIVQWYDGRYGFTSGYPGHPPLMSTVWGVLDRIWPGPGLMFGLQLGLFAAATGLLLQAVRPRLALALGLAASVFLQPYIFSNLLRINKDVLGGSAVLLAFALAFPRGPARHWPIVLAGTLIAMASLCRYQFVVAAPVHAWIVFRSQGTRSALIAVASVVLSGLGLLALLSLGPKPPGDVEVSFRKIMSYDLAGIAVNVPGTHLDTLSPSEGDGIEIVRRMRAQYSTAKVDTLWDTKDSAIELLDRVPFTSLYAAWVQEASNHPAALFRHRIAAFARVLGVGDMTDCAAVSRTPTAPDPPELAARLQSDRLLQPYALQVLQWRVFPVESFIFRPITYALLAIIGCIVSLTWQVRRPEMVWARWSLLLSLAYWSTFFVLPQACDGRYSFLPVTLTMLVVTIMAVAGARGVAVKRRLVGERP